MDITEVLSKLKPEHASIVKTAFDEVNATVAKANESITTLTAEKVTLTTDLEKAKEELQETKDSLQTAEKALQDAENEKPCECDGDADENGICKKCGKLKKVVFDEEETMKSLPEGARAFISKLRAQKEAAEAEVRKAKDAEKQAEAVAKAATLKAIPVEQEKLIGILKSCDQSVVDLLTAVNTAIEGTVLDEVGKNRTTPSNSSDEAWAKIENKADEIVTRDSVTKQKAIATVIKECPELYKDYLKGGTI